MSIFANGPDRQALVTLFAAAVVDGGTEVPVVCAVRVVRVDGRPVFALFTRMVDILLGAPAVAGGGKEDAITGLVAGYGHTCNAGTVVIASPFPGTTVPELGPIIIRGHAPLAAKLDGGGIVLFPAAVSFCRYQYAQKL